MRLRGRSIGLSLVAAITLVATTLFGLSPAGAEAGPDSPVFVNELHYDNTGTDTGESIEIAGPAGTVLDGWEVVLYNGSNGSVYDTLALSGTLADEAGGYGFAVIDLATNGLQNGSPDGLALVDDAGAVVQFLSYEGTLTAVGGPADGLTSTDIGVAETSSTAVGESLQLTGTGTVAGDFTWTGPLAATSGAVNEGQVFDGGGPAVPDVAISELHYDNAGTDVGEFFEVSGPAGTDLDGWSMELYNGSNGTVYDTVTLSGVFTDQADGRGFIAFPLATNGLQNGSPDGLALVAPDGTVVEFVSYEGTLTASGGSADGTTSTDIGVAEASDTPVGQSLQLVDGAWTGPTDETPGAPNEVVVPLPDVAISELHYDNIGTDVDEFFEVSGPAGTDLAGWTVVLYNGSNGTAYGTVALGGVLPDQDGGRGFVFVPLAANGLQNGSPDGLALVAPDGTVVEFLSYEGSFTAVGGAADGVASTDIGVAEAGDTPVGQSLQLIDGTWTGPIDATPGLPNGGGGPVTGQPFPFISNFDGADCEAEGWQVVSVDSDTANTWSCSPTFQNADVNGFGDSAPADEWLITPALDLEAQTGETLQFRSYTNFTDVAGTYPQLEVVYSTDYDGSDPAAATWTALTGITFSPEGSGDWTDSGVIDLSGLSGSAVYVAFHYTSTGTGAGSAANWRIDAVEFDTGATGGPTEYKIHEIQGSGPAIPAEIAGTQVTIQGIVTSLFEDNDTADGFFVQEEDADADTDPSTSEGIFVFCRGGCPTVATGDLVTVTGTAEEFFGMSQVDMSFGSGTAVVESSGNPLPAPVTLSLPAPGPTNENGETTFEPTEGMIVTFSGKLVVSEYFQLARYGEVVLTADERPEQFTDANTPDVDGYAAFLADLATRQIILDDNNNDQNDATTAPDANEPYPYPVGGLSTTNTFRGGDSITDLTGVLHWSFAGFSGTDAWRIRQVEGEDYAFTSENPRPAAPDEVGGRISVASFNVLNYFTTLDAPGEPLCGPNLLDCRGAHSEAELARQRDKIVAALSEIDADVVGLIEIENDAGASVADLVGALNDTVGAGTYDYIDTGTIGGDAIKVALIYKPGTVTPIGDFAILDSSVDPTFIDTKNRPVLVQTFADVTQARFTVAVNHLKSKGSPCDDVGDPDANDGQANCSGTRTLAAQALANFLATDPTGSGDPDFLIIGDLNAYAQEDPITALEAAGYTDLIDTFVGPDAYSFVFDSQIGYLDHALANGSLLGQVTGVTEWGINADEIPLLDYNDSVLDDNEQSFERESDALDIYDPDPYPLVGPRSGDRRVSTSSAVSPFWNAPA